ncbi:MAG: M48 family metallopeptidase [Candidatus Pacebacteria bacterium]|nr:M48 family metallopeptidase [Candidatus Paceibacterota bacterium]
MSLNFNYQVKKSSKARSIKISIDAKGKILVTAPKLYPNLLIDKFLKQQEPWVLRKQAEVAKLQVKIKKNEIYIFGEKYQILVEVNPKQRPGLSIHDQQVIITQLSASSYQTKLERFLKNTATKYLSQKTAILGKKMKIDYQKIGIRQQKSRWGSCSSQGNLNFNWRLVHYPPEIINYVIIHELAHRQEANHSKNFWQLVAKYDPDYKKHKNALKKRLYN